MATIGVSPQAAASFAQTSLGNAVLPAPALHGWPLSVDSAIAWDGVDLREDHYVHTLNESETQEIEAALAKFKGSCPHPESTCSNSSLQAGDQHLDTTTASFVPQPFRSRPSRERFALWLKNSTSDAGSSHSGA